MAAFSHAPTPFSMTDLSQIACCYSNALTQSDPVPGGVFLLLMAHHVSEDVTHSCGPRAAWVGSDRALGSLSVARDRAIPQ
jgi:hypothetical protein